MKRKGIAGADSKVEQAVLAGLRQTHREFLFAGTFSGWNPQALPVHTLSGKSKWWSAKIELTHDADQYELPIDRRWRCNAV